MIETSWVFKICPGDAWRQAEESGRFTGSPVDLADGYIHLSAADQVAETAARHFRGQSGLVLVAFDVADLGDDLRWEASRGGRLFPHVYGNLPAAAAKGVWTLLLGADGVPVLPAELARC